MPPASASVCARAVARAGRAPAFAFRCSSRAEPAQIEAAAAIGAPVIEIHTGAWCERWRRATMPPRPAEFERIARGAALAAQRRPRSPCRPRPRFPQRRDDRGAAGNRRAQHRAFPDRRGDLRRASADACARCARRWTAAAPRSRKRGACHDPRHRLRHHRRAPHRQGDRAPRRALPRSRLHRRPNAPRPSKRRNRVETYAKRFAAKEACAKALGTGLRARRVVARHGRGQSAVGAADHATHRRRQAAARRRSRPPGYEARIDLTITDEGPMAQAFVVISAVPSRA